MNFSHNRKSDDRRLAQTRKRDQNLQQLTISKPKGGFMLLQVSNACVNFRLTSLFKAVVLLAWALPLPIFAQSASRYDGKAPLQCGQNVNCSDHADVVSKMKQRWVAHSSKTNYSDPCFQAINRVQRIPPNIWDSGMAQQQMEVCNMQ